jgi:hypothetical protein
MEEATTSEGERGQVKAHEASSSVQFKCCYGLFRCRSCGFHKETQMQISLRYLRDFLTNWAPNASVSVAKKYFANRETRRGGQGLGLMTHPRSEESRSLLTLIKDEVSCLFSHRHKTKVSQTHRNGSLEVRKLVSDATAPLPTATEATGSFPCAHIPTNGT